MQSRHEQTQATLTWHLEKMIEVASELENGSGWTWAHSGRVARYAVTMGKALRLDEEQMMALQCASLLHDVGKMIVPEEMLNKISTLSRDEWYTITKHPMASARIIKGQSLALQIAAIARSHHEWFNGQGYPMGLQGEAIPLGARILSLADAYDAMSSDRPYRRALQPDEIMNQIDRGAGVQFDPLLVNRLRPLLVSGLSTHQPVRKIVVFTDDTSLVQQLRFALYPHGWEIETNTDLCAEIAQSINGDQHPQDAHLRILVVDGRYAAAPDCAELEGLAIAPLWIDPPTGKTGLKRPLDLAGLLREIHALEKPAEVGGAVRVLLADPFQLFRQALTQGLESRGSIVVVAEAATPSAFRKVRDEVAHDIAIVASDLITGTLTTAPLREENGLLEEAEALPMWTAHPPAIVLVSDEDMAHPELAAEVWQTGTEMPKSAHIYRGSPIELLIEAVHTRAVELVTRPGTLEYQRDNRLKVNVK